MMQAWMLALEKPFCNTSPTKMTEFEPLKMLAFMFWGADWLLVVQGITRAVVVFPHKRKKMFILIVAGLVSSLLNSSLAMAEIYFGNPLIYYTIFGLSSWYVMIFTSSYVYAIRIKSLGGHSKFDKSVQLTPWIILIFAIPVNTIGLLSRYLPQLVSVNLISSTIFSVFLAVGEIYLYSVLLYKISDILEYRDGAKRILIYQLTASLGLLTILEVLLIASKLSSNAMDRFLRPFNYTLRLVLVIQFFDDLLQELENSSGFFNGDLEQEEA